MKALSLRKVHARIFQPLILTWSEMKGSPQICNDNFDDNGISNAFINFDPEI